MVKININDEVKFIYIDGCAIRVEDITCIDLSGVVFQNGFKLLLSKINLEVVKAELQEMPR